MNNFKDYGFEADFDGEIYTSYKSNDNQIFYNGAVWFRPNDDYHYMKPVSWNERGEIIHYYYQEHYLTQFNLKPLKKEWYENSDNFPCLLIDDLKEPTDKNKFWYCPSAGIAEQAILFGDLRPATKEEVLDLLVKA